MQLPIYHKKVHDDTIIARKLTLPYAKPVLLLHLKVIASNDWRVKSRKNCIGREFISEGSTSVGKWYSISHYLPVFSGTSSRALVFLGPNYWFSVFQYWGNKFWGIEIQIILEQRDIINQFGLLGPICGSHVLNINEPERPIKCKDTKVPKKGASKLSIEQ